jgi:carbon storage regulator CsrA
MLVLSRKVGESVIIGELSSPDHVVVQLLAIDAHKVRIGIQAPADIRVDRKEVAIARLGWTAMAGSMWTMPSVNL